MINQFSMAHLRSGGGAQVQKEKYYLKKKEVKKRQNKTIELKTVTTKSSKRKKNENLLPKTKMKYKTIFLETNLTRFSFIHILQDFQIFFSSFDFIFNFFFFSASGKIFFFKLIFLFFNFPSSNFFHFIPLIVFIFCCTCELFMFTVNFMGG